MTATPESKVKAAVKKYLDSLGFWRAGANPPDRAIIGWYYMPVSNGMGVHGIPDFVCVYQGLSLFIETKAPGGELTENQRQRIHEIQEAGGVAIVAYSVDDVKAYLEGDL